MIELKPLTVKWEDWRAHARSMPKPKNNLESIMRDVTAWQKRVNAWMESLTEQQEKDLLQLASAEIDMLYCSADIPKDSQYLEDQRLDFRTRFYEVQALLNTCWLLDIPNAKHVKDELDDLEQYVTKRHDWLP